MEKPFTKLPPLSTAQPSGVFSNKELHEESVEVGLDIGDHWMRLIALQRTPTGHVEILGFETLKTRPDAKLSRPVVPYLTRQIRSLLVRLENNIGIKIPSLSLTFSSHYGQMSGCSWTFNDPNAKVPIYNSYHQVINNLSTARLLSQCLQRISVGIKDISLSTQSAAQAVLSKSDMEVGTVLVSIGALSTEVAIFKQLSLQYLSTIPFGGHTLTQYLEQMHIPSLWLAEAAKVKFGAAIAQESEKNKLIVFENPKTGQASEVSMYLFNQTLEKAMRSLVRRIREEIRMHTTSGAGMCQRIILTGGSSNLKQIIPLFQTEIGLETHIGQLIATNWRRETDNSPFVQPEYASCLGVAMLGLGH